MGKIKNIEDLKRLIRANKDVLKKYVLPIGVGLLLIIFWIIGGMENNEPIVIENSDASTEVATEEKIESSDAVNNVRVFVDIGGEISSPGVYEVDEGTRLFQLIEKAGGLKENADVDSINQAETVTDGQKIIIGSTDKNSQYYTGKDGAEGIYTGRTAVSQVEDGYIVNINLADTDDLQLLPGVGPSTAQKIVSYREENGKFVSKEDIKNISGIGEKTYEKMKDYIIV